MARANSDFSATPFKPKIANAEQQAKLPASSRRWRRLITGARDLEAGAVRVRLHHGGPQGAEAVGARGQPGVRQNSDAVCFRLVFLLESV